MTEGIEGLLLAGEIGKPHGLGGYVYMVPISDDPHRWDPGARLVLPDGTDLVVEAARTHKGSRLLVKFEGVSSRSDAEGLRGPVYITPRQRRELKRDEYWQDDLVGCAVVSPEGAELGRVTGVVPGPVQDLMAVERQGASRLVPLVTAIVVEVDLESRRVVVDPPEGLLD